MYSNYLICSIGVPPSGQLLEKEMKRVLRPVLKKGVEA
jgi:hypothetical protein